MRAIVEGDAQSHLDLPADRHAGYVLDIAAHRLRHAAGTDAEAA
jgi:hypothetical protein